MKKEELMNALTDIDDNLLEAADGSSVKRWRRGTWIGWAAAAAVVLLAVTAAFTVPGLLPDKSPNKVGEQKADSHDAVSLLPQAQGVYGLEIAHLSDEGRIIPAESVLPLPSMADEDLQSPADEGPGLGDWEGPQPLDITGEPNPWMFYIYRVDSEKYAPYEKGRVITASKVGQKLEEVTVTAGWSDGYGVIYAGQEEHARAELFEITGVSTDVAVAIRFLDPLAAQDTTSYYVILNPEADLTPVIAYKVGYSGETQEQAPGSTPVQDPAEDNPDHTREAIPETTEVPDSYEAP